MSMATRIYPLPGGYVDKTKVWYPLSLGMGMGMNYGDGYGITKPVSAPPHCILNHLIKMTQRTNNKHNNKTLT